MLMKISICALVVNTEGACHEHITNACPPAQIGLQRTHGQIPPRLRWSRRVGTGTVLPRTRQPKEGKLQEGFGGRIGPEKLLSSSSSVESLSQRAFIEINCIRLRLPVPIHRVEALTARLKLLRWLRSGKRQIT